jgi:hypothetical protein
MSVFVPGDLGADAKALGWLTYPEAPDVAYTFGSPELRAWMAAHLDELAMRRIRQAAALLEAFARQHCPEVLP